MTLRVGVCGWCRAQDEVLAAHELLEDQRTFYEPPQTKTAKRGQGKAPDGFAFTVKAWQLVTHPASSPTYRKADLDLDDVDPSKRGYVRPTDPVYLRLHGSPPGDRRYYHTYTDEDLDRIAEWVADADRAWVLFNNKTMFEDARRFRERVGEAVLGRRGSGGASDVCL